MKLLIGDSLANSRAFLKKIGLNKVKLILAMALALSDWIYVVYVASSWTPSYALVLFIVYQILTVKSLVLQADC